MTEETETEDKIETINIGGQPVSCRVDHCNITGESVYRFVDGLIHVKASESDNGKTLLTAKSSFTFPIGMMSLFDKNEYISSYEAILNVCRHDLVERLINEAREAKVWVSKMDAYRKFTFFDRVKFLFGWKP